MRKALLALLIAAFVINLSGCGSENPDITETSAAVSPADDSTTHELDFL